MHGSPVIPGPGTPSGALPGARGGHPEQREPGGAWGLRGSAGGGTGAWAGGGRPPGGNGRAADGPPGRPPGPRQEYLDAFEDDVFAAGSRSRSAVTDTSPPPGVPRSRRPGDRVAGPPQVGGTPGGQDPPGPGDEADVVPHPAEPDTGRPARAGTKGRTFTGVAAAAVTTVLAIVVAGQVTGTEQRSGDRAQAGTEAGTGLGEDASAGGAPSPGPSSSARPATYGEKIAGVQPLDPDLHGPGEFTVVGGPQKASGEGEVVRYRVEVEKELPLDAELFAEAVHRTLNDGRSWAHDGARSFERVAAGEDADFVITLASPGTTGVWCAKSGLDTTVRNVSCDSASTERVMINAWRWAQGSETFGDERIREYREMLINHEVGHRLGLGHRTCASDGARAPVMMQQTKTLTTGPHTCRPNAWPYPEQGG